MSRAIRIMALALVVGGCQQNANQSMSSEPEHSVEDKEWLKRFNAAMEKCSSAATAYAKAMEKVDADYRRRNNGVPLGTWNASEFQRCSLTKEAAFISKRAGFGWKYVPFENGSYSSDPKIIRSNDEGIPIWFSEWRSTTVSDTESDRLTKQLESAMKVMK